MDPVKNRRICKRILSTVNTNCRWKCRLSPKSYKPKKQMVQLQGDVPFQTQPVMNFTFCLLSYNLFHLTKLTP